MTASAIFSGAATLLRERSASAIFSGAANVTRERAPSAVFTGTVIALRDKLGSAIFSGEVETLGFLLTGKQIEQGGLAADRLVNIPVQVLASRSGATLTSTIVSELYSVPSGQIAIILGIIFEATSVDTVTTPPEVSVGIASGETDIFPNETMINFDSLGNTWSNWLVFSKAKAAIGGETVKMNLTGATANILISNIHLIGFLI